MIRDALAPHKDELLDKLWAVAEKPDKGKESQRLRAAAALAKYDPESEKWAKVQDAVGNDLVNEPCGLCGRVDGIAASGACPVAAFVVRGVWRHESSGGSGRWQRTFWPTMPPISRKCLADLVMDADEKQFAIFFPKLKERGEQGLPVLIGEIDKKLPPDAKDEAKEKLAKRQANAAVALLEDGPA